MAESHADGSQDQITHLVIDGIWAVRAGNDVEVLAIAAPWAGGLWGGAGSPCPRAVFSQRPFAGRLLRVVDRAPIAPVSRATGVTMSTRVCSVFVRLAVLSMFVAIAWMLRRHHT